MPDVKAAVAEPSAAPVQFDSWDDKGNPVVSAQVQPKTQDPAPADAPKAEKSEAKAENAAEPEAAPHSQEKKGKKNAEERIAELIAENKQLKAKEAERERSREAAPKPPAEPEAKVEAKAEAPKKPVRPNIKEFDGTPGKTFEDYEVALSKYETERDEYFEKIADWKADEKVRQDRELRAREAQQGKLREQYEEAKKRYPDYDETIEPLTGELIAAKDIHVAVKQAIGSAENYIDLLYVLNQEKDSFLKLARENPAGAIKRIAVLEYLTREQLAKGSKKSDDPDPKAPAPEKPRAPKPPSEVGGRGTAAEDPSVAAARSGDYRSFEEAENAKMRARASK